MAAEHSVKRWLIAGAKVSVKAIFWLLGLSIAEAIGPDLSKYLVDFATVIIKAI